MTINKKILTGIATAIACSATVYAEDNDRKPGDDRRKEMHAKMLERFDADKDGKLNEEERKAAREAMRKKRGNRGDRPELTEEQRAEMKKQREEAKAKMLERFDTNKDGELSEEEKKAMREAIGAKRQEIHEAVLEEFDKNGNGKIDEDEREGVREWVKENYPDAARMMHKRGGKNPGKRGGKRGGKGGGDKRGGGNGQPEPLD